MRKFVFIAFFYQMYMLNSADPSNVPELIVQACILQKPQRIVPRKVRKVMAVHGSVMPVTLATT